MTGHLFPFYRHKLIKVIFILEYKTQENTHLKTQRNRANS